MKHSLEEVASRLLEIAEIASGSILMHYAEEEKATRKEDGSPVTPADLEANRLIVEGLNRSFPGIPVLAEESPDNSARKASRWLFLVDPLDGTKEYLARNGEFSVNIALLEEGQPVVGVVRMPVSGRVFHAVQGQGAWMSDPTGLLQPMQVSERTEGLILALSRSHATTELERIASHPKISRTVRAGSALKGCMVACGEADAYYRFGRTMEWDTAAMQCIVEEAGGVMRQMDGTPMVYNKPVPDNPKGFFILNRMENRLDR